MDGVHDIGGMHGFGPVEPEADEPVFHADWEARMFALSSAVPFAVPYSDDHFRRDMERMNPAAYLAASYYERWLASVLSLLTGRGIVDAAELAGGALKPLPPGVRPALSPDMVAAAIRDGASQGAPDEAGTPHRFRVGDRVRTAAVRGPGHTRLPRYARGKIGTVRAEHGSFTFADAHAAGLGRAPQQLYTVEFAARELWGDEAAAGDTLCLDLWDAYLEPAG